MSDEDSLGLMGDSIFDALDKLVEEPEPAHKIPPVDDVDGEQPTDKDVAEMLTANLGTGNEQQVNAQTSLPVQYVNGEANIPAGVVDDDEDYGGPAEPGTTVRPNECSTHSVQNQAETPPIVYKVQEAQVSPGDSQQLGQETEKYVNNDVVDGVMKRNFRTKPGRKRKTAADQLEKPPYKKVSAEEKEDPKYLARREKNALATKRCRDNKKAKDDAKDVENKQLKEQVAALKKANESLTAENNQLRNGCHCANGPSTSITGESQEPESEEKYGYDFECLNNNK